MSASTSYNGTQAAINAGDYDLLQSVPKDVMINNRVLNLDLDTLHVDNADIGARVPWGGAIPPNAPLSIVAIQMLLNKAGQTPPLDTDDVSGASTKAAIIASKRKYGLPADTTIDWVKWLPLLCKDAGVKILMPGAGQTVAAAMPLAADSIIQRVARLELTIGVSGVSIGNADFASSGHAPGSAYDPINQVERLLAIVQKAQTPALSTNQAPGSGGGNTDTPPLGQVNRALGSTLGNLLNGKKTAIGITGAMLTETAISSTSNVGIGGGIGQAYTIGRSQPLRDAHFPSSRCLGRAWQDGKVVCRKGAFDITLVAIEIVRFLRVKRGRPPKGGTTRSPKH